MALGLASAASATPPAPALGTTEFVADVVPAPAGPNTKTQIHVTGTMDGTFEGTTVGDYHEVIRNPTGTSEDSQIQGFIRCECTVDGRSGTVTFANAINARFDLTTFDFRLEGSLVVVAATGELRGLRAVLVNTFEDGVSTYTGTYHFEGS